eukprot:m.262301 g.262301  ORF g.262301 m.262301 type:complete len:578 (-) comp45108_c0_seq1:67-1800(-)
MTNVPEKKAGKDWFGVQLEVTQRLLEAENRRLEQLEATCASPTQDGTEADAGFVELAQKQLRSQLEELNAEYEQAAHRMLLGPRQRSNPTLGVRSNSKSRSCIFDSVAKRKADKAAGVDSADTENSPANAEDLDTPLIMEAGRVKSGTLDALCNLLNAGTTGGADKLFTFTFLVGARTFVHPADVLERLLEDTKALFETTKDKHALGVKICRILREWTRTCAYDFGEKRMRSPFANIVVLVSNCGEDAKLDIAQVQTSVIRKLQKLEAYEKRLRREYANARRVKRETISKGSGILPASSEKDITDLISDATSLAEQLTYAEQERIGMIEASEFVDTFVDNNTPTEGRTKVANIIAYIEWFNRLGGLVATEICRQPSKKKRSKALEFWIEVAKVCKTLRNYNSLMAIVSALNMTSVSRIKKTWANCKKSSLSTFAELEETLDPAGNFRNYREEIASLKETDTCIPFFSLLVKDMYFIKECAAKTLPNGHINFERLWPLSECLAEFLIRKQQQRAIEPIDDVQSYVRTMPVCSEAELFRCSVENEPPNKDDYGKTMTRLKRLSTEEENSANQKISTHTM